MENLKQRVMQAKHAIERSEYILIGGGAGLSAAAGLTYSGKRFTDNFSDFMDKYGFTDMYAGTFYPFETQEELWAHWARHINLNRYQMPATLLYKEILEMVKDKDYFVISTNVESQFVKSGFPKEKIIEVQGNYSYLQCAKGCHNKLYYNEDLIKQIVEQTNDCRIPTELVPKCPVCGGPMDINIRHNDYFVQDEAWYEAYKRYEEFLHESTGKDVVYLEFGVGFNTPGIIRYPFEQMTYQNPSATLIRFNRDYPYGVTENAGRTISFDEDILMVVQYMKSNTKIKKIRHEMNA